MDSLSNLNLHKNELQNARLQNLAVAPLDPKLGQMYYDTTLDVTRQYTSKGWVSIGGEGHVYTFSETETNGTFGVKEDDGEVQEIPIHGLKTAAYTDIDAIIDDEEPSTENVPTSGAVVSYVLDAISGLVGGVHYRGTVGTGGDLPSLPDDSEEGDMYIIVSKGTYDGKNAKVGDVFICKADGSWSYIPSGDDGDAFKFQTMNPFLESQNGVCVWTVEHGLGNKYVTQNLYRIDTGEQVLADVTYISDSTLTVTIVSASNITAGTFGITCIG